MRLLICGSCFKISVFNTVVAQRGRDLTVGEAECPTRLGYNKKIRSTMKGIKMNRLSETFQLAKKENRAALIGYITAGDPDMELSFEIIDAACEAGLDILELGIPFSDPTADGPVIQRAANRAIRAGMTLEKGVKLVQRLRERHDIPIIIFTYYNPILAMGTERFVSKAIDAGADGVLAVDLPSENADEILQFVDSDKTFSLIRLVAPTTDPVRRQQILSEAEGFVYIVSRRGVTGSGKINWNALAEEMDILRKATETPLCVGFGISTPEDVQSAAKIADGVIVGSAIQKIVEEQNGESSASVVKLIRNLYEATFR